MRELKPRTSIATYIEPGFRVRLDAAITGSFSAYHARSVSEILRAVKTQPIDAVLVSPGVVGPSQLSGIASLVRAFPGVSTIAVIAEASDSYGQRLLDLGATGVRRFVDVKSPAGWKSLRETLEFNSARPANVLVNRVMSELGRSTSAELRKFMEFLVRESPAIKTVRQLSRRLGVPASTIMSRFTRAGLPSPKTYLAFSRLLHAAALLERDGYSISDVAYRLGYSSPQSFGRHLRVYLGITAGQFRDRYDLGACVEMFAERFIKPYRAVFRQFQPIPNGMSPGRRRWAALPNSEIRNGN